MRSLLILSLLVLGAFCSFHEQLMKDLFHQWKLTHDKTYLTAHEEQHRYNIFVENYISILEFNAEDDSVTLGLNQFADLTSEEFRSLYTTPLEIGERTNDYYEFDESQDPPTTIDWRAKGAVTPIKNQGTCGSCWAFSTVGALEGLYFINNSKLVPFSEQNLVSCVKKAYGCSGGWPFIALDYVANNGGIESEADYPYTANNSACAFDQSKAYKVSSGYYNVTPHNITQMKLAVAQQPVSIVIEGDGLAMQFYKSGVIKRFCGPSPDHAVLIVGYDIVKDTEAFIVKNSWGEKWGMNGYVYISSDPTANKGSGLCGIYNYPTIPTNA